MKFSELTSLNFEHDFEVSKLCLDSRKVENNSIFFAIKGNNLNGEDFIDSAIEKGAEAIIIDKRSHFELDGKNKKVNILRVSDVREFLAKICEKFYTSLPENIVAVTGTNGKTSTACFFAKILVNLGHKSAAIGTLGTLLNGDFNQNIDESGLTTPDLISLYENLIYLKSIGVEHVCLEASSHGLEQKRLGNLKFSATAFLNLSQDHLDYHQTMERYFSAKKLLFQNHMRPGSLAVLNKDITQYKDLENLNSSVLSYGKHGKDLKISNILATQNGISFFLNGKQIETNLIGEFQVYNLTCAIGLAKAIGLDESEITKAIQNISSVRGRMELIKFERKNITIIIDYAHTPDALEKAIEALKAHKKNKIITVFGCGGDRDKSKRLPMAKAACENSDLVIVTDDNPRNENAEEIRRQVMQGCKNARNIGDRKIAIETAINTAERRDIVLIAGKGHENYQIVGDKKFHFDDAELVKNYIVSDYDGLN